MGRAGYFNHKILGARVEDEKRVGMMYNFAKGDPGGAQVIY